MIHDNGDYCNDQRILGFYTGKNVAPQLIFHPHVILAKLPPYSLAERTFIDDWAKMGMAYIEIMSYNGY